MMLITLYFKRRDNIKRMFRQDKAAFRQQQEEQVKNIVKDIKTYYFQFLSSLKYENLDLKKTQKDFKTAENATEEIQELGHIQLQNLSEDKLHFEDEMLSQNKGQIAFLLMTQKIKELKNFNSNLKYQIIAYAPKSLPSQNTNSSKQ